MNRLGRLSFLPVLAPLAVFAWGGAKFYLGIGVVQTLALAAPLALALHLPQEPPRRGANLAPFLACLLLGLWSHLTGFAAIALGLGLAAPVFAARAATGRPAGLETAGLLLVLLAAFAPFVEAEAIPAFRALSVRAVDRMLAAAGVPFERTGFTYRLPGLVTTVEERCSGYSGARLLLVALLALAATRRSAAGLAAAPLLALPAALLANTLRIGLHLLLSRQAGAELAPLLHASLGLALFLACAAPAVALTLKWPGHPAPDPAADTTFPEGDPAGSGGVPGTCPPRERHPFFLAATFIAAFGGLIVLPAYLGKRIDHRHVALPAAGGGILHLNRFVESPGGGTWLTLENPLRSCFLYLGYAEGADGGFSRPGERAGVVTRFTVGGRTCATPLGAALLKFVDLPHFAEPLAAEIDVTEERPR